METDVTAVLTLLQHGNQLKRTARTGWVQRGVANAENVAAHSYGVIFTALTLAQLVEVPLDLTRVLLMATLHDLPEGLTSDIPTPAWRYLPEGSKPEVERTALKEILQNLPFATGWMHVWEELQQKETAEARLVKDADKLEQFIQALNYEQQTGNRQLDEFWTIPHRFHFAEAQQLYDALRRKRGA